MQLLINGQRTHADADPATPLLWVLRDQLNLTGTKFGCGIAACGACTVHVDGQAVRSCVTPVSAVQGKDIRTIESLGSAEHPHALQQAWIAEQVPQCGYCQSGMLMAAAALLARTPHPTPPMPTSTRPWTISAAAAPTNGYAPRFTALPTARCLVRALARQRAQVVAQPPKPTGAQHEAAHDFAERPGRKRRTAGGLGGGAAA